MPLRINNNILNQKGTPAFFSDVFANRPTFGYAGRVFISTDTGQIYEDTGTAWTLIADAGVGGGTLASVCANGNTTATGMTITAGNLGIGTATAGAPLDIHGTGTIAQFNGTGTNNAYVFFQNAGTSKWRLGNNYSAGANSFDLYNNTLASVALSVNNPYNVLQLNANLAIKQSTGIYTIAGYNAIACDSGGFFFNCSTANTAYFNLINLTGSRSYTFPDTNGTLALTSDLSSYLPLTGGTLTGNLGITKTSAPSKLSILQSNDTLTNGIRIYRSNNADFFETYMSGGFGNLNDTYNFYSSFSGAIVAAIDRAGQAYFASNVGVGTSSPNTVTGTVQLTLKGISTATPSIVSVNSYDNGSTLGIYSGSSSADNPAIFFQNSLRIATTSGTGLGSFTERMIIKGTNNGTVVFGTAEAAANSINFYGNYSNNQAGMVIYGSTSNLLLEFNGNTKALYLGNLGTGTLYSNSGIISNTSPSDIRLKDNVQVLKYGLKDILKLRPVTYNWKKDDIDQGIQFGFIAQEVQEVIPEAVKEFGTDIKYLGLEKDAIYGALVNAIKELNDKIDNLKN